MGPNMSCRRSRNRENRVSLEAPERLHEAPYINRPKPIECHEACAVTTGNHVVKRLASARQGIRGGAAPLPRTSSDPYWKRWPVAVEQPLRYSSPFVL
jgi:hypothetical protein